MFFVLRYNRSMNTRHIILLKKILILSATAGTLGLIRFALTEQTSYLWLNWNLFLALVPIFFAWLTTKLKNEWISFGLILIWLGFLPNAPYIITDFIHLADVGPKSMLWSDAIMIFTYSVAGLLAWVLSFDILRSKFKWKLWSVWFIGLLSGFGLYLGRYIRFNTWDVVTKPIDLFETIGAIILSPESHEPVISMTLTFTIFLSIFYIYLQPLLHDEKTKN